MQLLRECVKTMLAEETRSAYRRLGMFKSEHRFSMTRFRTLQDRSTMHMYALYFLKKLGNGSSRTVFLLDSRRVLKLAVNDLGVDQNEAEVAVSRGGGADGVVARVLEVGPNREWLISELVRPLSGEAEFEKLTSVSWEEFTTELEWDAPSTPWTAQVLKAVNLYNLAPGDITKLMHWGKTADGRAVLLDYGLTRATRINRDDDIY